MAVLDPRLLDLIDSLVKARLDWLAFELIDGIQIGRPASESENVLAAAREEVRSNKQPQARGESTAVTAESQPIAGDDQIEWAATFVGERLDAALAQLDASMTTLDGIIAGPEAQPDDTKTPYLEGSILVLAGEEQPRTSKRENVEQARIALPALKDGLALWSEQMRGGVQV